MSYRFLVCELKTGDVIREAPLTVSGSLDRVLQGAGEGTLDLPIRDKGCPKNWEQLILPWRALLLAVDDQDHRIIWHGIPQNRIRQGGGIVSYPCETLEAYLLHRYVPDRVYLQRDQADIARDLVRLAGDEAGLPLRYDCPLTGVPRDRTYLDDEDARVYSRLQELAATENGFDWTLDVDWADDTRSRVKYTFRTGFPHLGNRTAEPEHLFALPGNITDYRYEEPWQEGDAATMVEAVGDSAAESTVRSTPIVDTLRERAGWPRLEERRKFDGVTVQRTIDQHVHAMAAQLFGGQQVITATVKSDAGTALRDLNLGDSARVKIASEDLTLDEVWVVVGWKLTPSSSTYAATLARLGGP